jgi:hypothetical protein
MCVFSVTAINMRILLQMEHKCLEEKTQLLTLADNWYPIGGKEWVWVDLLGSVGAPSI